jgi:hypothetical protein
MKQVSKSGTAQIVLTSAEISKAVNAARTEFLKQPEGRVQTPMSLYEINCGWCGDFADRVEWLLGLTPSHLHPGALIVENDNFRTPIDGDPDSDGERRWDSELLQEFWGMAPPAKFSWETLEDIDFGGHIWFAARTGSNNSWMHFDSECAEGVENFFDLPIFARALARDWPTMEEIQSFPRDQVWTRAAQDALRN